MDTALFRKLREEVAKVSAFAEMYEKLANSRIRDQAELESTRNEMKLIRKEMLSYLSETKRRLESIRSSEGMSE